MSPRYRIRLAYISAEPNNGTELRYIIQRRTWLFFWKDITHRTLSKEEAKSILKKLLHEETET